VIAFVIFIVALSIAYLALWLPFVIKLSKDMWRSKSMLSIIPIEVILRMPRINQFLLKQSFSEIKVTKQDSPSKPHKGRGDEDEDD
jgi:predicted CDP-diglyceride synthetase/phosphatidate cytidylyltransferase